MDPLFRRGECVSKVGRFCKSKLLQLGRPVSLFNLWIFQQNFYQCENSHRNSSRAWIPKESAVSLLWLCLSQQKRPENACEETSIIKFSTCFRYWKCDKIWPLVGCGRDTFMINVFGIEQHTSLYKLSNAPFFHSKQ